jgi:hypothetical protein
MPARVQQVDTNPTAIQTANRIQVSTVRLSISHRHAAIDAIGSNGTAAGPRTSSKAARRSNRQDPDSQPTGRSQRSSRSWR